MVGFLRDNDAVIRVRTGATRVSGRRLVARGAAGVLALVAGLGVAVALAGSGGLDPSSRQASNSDLPGGVANRHGSSGVPVPSTSMVMPLLSLPEIITCHTCHLLS